MDELAHELAAASAEFVPLLDAVEPEEVAAPKGKQQVSTIAGLERKRALVAAIQAGRVPIPPPSRASSASSTAGPAPPASAAPAGSWYCKSDRVYDVVVWAFHAARLSRTEDPAKASITYLQHSAPSDVVRGIPARILTAVPGVRELAMKIPFGRHLQRMVALYPADFAFCPPTFISPYDDIKALPRGVAYIVKPSAGLQGDGIVLTLDAASCPEAAAADAVVQEYVATPLLCGGLKFDLRIYVLLAVAAGDAAAAAALPRVFVHAEGLVRFATEPYAPPTPANTARAYSHLTNYSLNKGSPTYVAWSAEAEAAATKRTFGGWLNPWLGDKAAAVWERIDAVVVRTVLSCLPSVASLAPFTAAPCAFHLLGFDVLLDSSLRPHLLEINAHPSLATPEPVDWAVKSAVVLDVLRVVSQGGPAGGFRELEVGAEVYAPLRALSDEWVRAFLRCCGVRGKGTVSQAAFARFARDCGVSPRFLSSAAVDLLFQRAARLTGGGREVFFSAWMDVVWHDFIPAAAPPGATPQQRLAHFLRENMAAVGREA